MLKIGSSRIAILIGRWAIKVPFSYCGVLQSRNEKRLYERHKRWPFMPIERSFGPILVMRRAEPLDKANRARFRDLARLAEERFEELRFDRGDIWRQDNWGQVAGLPLLLDYGLDEEIEKRYYPGSPRRAN